MVLRLGRGGRGITKPFTLGVCRCYRQIPAPVYWEYQNNAFYVWASNGFGTGYGFGFCYGFGYGFGYGTGYGHGSGFGYGSGSGSGSGSGPRWLERWAKM